MESVFDTLEREDFERTRALNLPPASSSVPVSRHLLYETLSIIEIYVIYTFISNQITG